jgi:hypothetical protein
MKRTIFFLMGILVLIPPVGAHGIEKGPMIRSMGAYQIQFSVEPKFPVTGRVTHLDLFIKDQEGNPLSGLETRLELHKEEKTIRLDLDEEEGGHYRTEYTFDEAGSYEVHLSIENEEWKTGFDLEIDTFGSSGYLRSGTIVLLLSILIGLMYRDCRRKGHG